MIFLHLFSRQIQPADHGLGHFVDRSAPRRAISLKHLRNESMGMLYCLKIFVPCYDINDVYKGAPMDRDPVIFTERCEYYHVPNTTSPSDYITVHKLEFNLDYDINDHEGKMKAEELTNITFLWKAEHPVIEK